MAKLWRKLWQLPCFVILRRPEQVLDYLGRYTHRVAISSHRIVALENCKPARNASPVRHRQAEGMADGQSEAGGVTFRYRDRKDNDTLIA